MLPALPWRCLGARAGVVANRLGCVYSQPCIARPNRLAAVIGPGLTLAHVWEAVRSSYFGDVALQRIQIARPSSPRASRTAKAIWTHVSRVLGVHVRERAGYFAGIVATYRI